MPVMQQPAGWYPNPVDATQLRWWDGNAWTDHTAPIPSWQPTPGWQMAPQQPKRRIWPWVVFPILAVFLIVGVAAAIFVPRVISRFTAPIDAANVYMRDVRDGRLQSAYNEACILRFGNMTYDQYVARIQSQEAETGHLLSFNAHQVHLVRGHSDQTVVDVDMTTTRDRFAAQAYMVKENGHWRWCGYTQVSK